MDARYISDIIGEVEAKTDIERWRLSGVNMWPLVRIELYQHLVRHQLNMNATPTSQMSIMEIAARLLGPLWANLQRGPKPEVGDVWLISDGVSLRTTGGEELDRFCMPLARASQEAGYRSFVADISRPDNTRLLPPTRLWANTVLMRKIANLLKASLFPDTGIRDLCGEMNAVLDGLGAKIALSAFALDSRIRAVLSLAEHFGRLLALHRPKAVFIVSYYQVAGYALNLAARRLGIPTIDIQHGVSGSFHPAYGRWTKVPIGGFELLPEGFWAWSGADARVIEDSLGRSGAHWAVSGGHPVVCAWQAGWIPDSAAQTSRVKNLKQQQTARHHILLTLQPGLSSREELGNLLAAMQELKDCFWWIRLHPTATGELSSITAMLDSAGTAFNIRDATDSPLYALLSSIDLHVTHSSSTVIEAAQFGIPSVIWSGYGADLFKDEIAAGFAVAAGPEEDFADTIKKALSRGPVSCHEVPSVQLQLTMQLILEHQNDRRDRL